MIDYPHTQAGCGTFSETVRRYARQFRCTFVRHFPAIKTGLPQIAITATEAYRSFRVTAIFLQCDFASARPRTTHVPPRFARNRRIFTDKLSTRSWIAAVAQTLFCLSHLRSRQSEILFFCERYERSNNTTRLKYNRGTARTANDHRIHAGGA